jgi:hypothetical protein
MAAGIGTEVYLKLGTGIAWTWFAAIGTVVTFTSAWLASPLFERDPGERG